MLESLEIINTGFVSFCKDSLGPIVGTEVGYLGALPFFLYLSVFGIINLLTSQCLKNEIK